MGILGENTTTGPIVTREKERERERARERAIEREREREREREKRRTKGRETRVYGARARPRMHASDFSIFERIHSGSPIKRLTPSTRTTERIGDLRFWPRLIEEQTAN